MVAPVQPPIEQTITVLHTIFQVRGLLRYQGNLSAFLNDEARPTLSLFNTTVLGLSMQNPAAQMLHPEFVMSKRQLHVIAFEGVPPTLSIPPRAESLVLYTEMFAVMGKFRMEQSVPLNTFAENYPSPFIVVTEARFFPLFAARPGLVNTASAALVHKSLFRAFHRA